MKNKHILILLACIVALAVSIVFNVRQFRQGIGDAARIAALSENTNAGEARIIERYTRDSIQHTVIREVPAQTNAEKAVALGSGYLDTLEKALKIATKQIEEVTKVNALLQTQNLRLQAVANSRKQTYNDRWLALTYDPDSNSVDLTYDVNLNVVKYWKRPWLLGAKQHYIDIFADDPRVSIGSVKRMTLAQPRQKRWGLGVQGGYGYAVASNRLAPYVGLGLQYDLISF